MGSGNANCTGQTRPCFNVNAQQKIELVQVTGGTPDNLLAEVAFATPDVARMRDYLVANGVTASQLTKDANGVSHFEFIDPEGHPLAFVQQPEAYFFTAPTEQVSTRIVHAGFIVNNRPVEDHFYADLLGFRLYWHGGFKDSDTDWVALQVPDGTDWIEYMLNIAPNADHAERGEQNHFSFAVEQMKPAFARLRAHGLKSTDEPEIGRDGKWQYDVFDPDATRVEFMEYKPTQQPCCNPYTGPQPHP